MAIDIVQFDERCVVIQKYVTDHNWREGLLTISKIYLFIKLPSPQAVVSIGRNAYLHE